MKFWNADLNCVIVKRGPQTMLWQSPQQNSTDFQEVISGCINSQIHEFLDPICSKILLIWHFIISKLH